MVANQLLPLHERDFASRCRIAHALVVGDQMSDNDVAELLHVRFYDVPDLVLKGAEMLRHRPEDKSTTVKPQRHVTREDVPWTKEQLAMLEHNRRKFRDQVLKKWGAS